MKLLKDETCSRSKRQKSHGGGGEGKRVEVVGIGRLPDAMLCHILSFLKTKDAVQTSVLSKRWRYVWTAVPCIDIQYPRYDESFPDFFDRFLRINIVSCLRKFRLSLTQDFDQLSEWISIVLKREIEEIVIHLWGSQSVNLPPSIFTCTKLVILRLSHANLLDVPPSVYLPSLKILEICLQKPFNEDSMTNLLDGCPVIEELDIQGDGDCNVKTLSFRSSSLKSLVINSSLNDVKIVVDIPNVERLDLVVLDYVNGQDCKQLSEWISFALKRDVEEIAKLPPAPSNFTCKKIVSLKLGYGILLDVPSSVYLPSLKILHLYLGKLFVKDSMANLLDGCPVIEELCIHRMKDYNVKTLIFRSSSLKSLSIDASSLNDLRIVVDVPNVERLHLRDHGNAQYDINNLSSLVNVKIYIWQGLGLFELLRKFTYTEYLFISFQTMKRVNYRHLDDFPMFHNLTHLVVDMYGPRRPVLPYLLECSPNLVIFDYSVSHKPSSRERHLQFKAPKCFLLYLEVIKLSGLRGFDDEVEMVRYFLKNAKVLKELSIQFGAGEKKKFEISKKLLKFAMSSPDCEIIFN